MAIEHPAGVRDISVRWLNAVLDESGFLGSARIRSFSNEPFDPGAGQLSAITRVRLEYERGDDLPSSLVLKFHAPSADAHDLSMRYRVYEREHRFFAEVAASRTLPVPKCHASAIDWERERFILFLEDLGHMELLDQIEGASYERAVPVVRALARLHASTWNRNEFLELDWIPYINDEVYQNLAVDFRKNWPRYWERFGATTPAGAQLLGEELCDRFGELLDRQAELAVDLGMMCICHGDTRLDNVAYGPGGAIYLLDWQLAFKNMGPTDVAYFLGGSLPTEVRRRHEVELVRLYHDELRAHGVEDLSLETCWDIYRLGHLFYLCYIVTGGTETDVENERSFRLFQTAGQRHFSSALDLCSLETVDRSYGIGDGRARPRRSRPEAIVESGAPLTR